MYHSVLSHLPTHSTKPCISLLLPSCMVFSCTLIEKILSVSTFLRTTGIKKKFLWVYLWCSNKHSHTTGHSPRFRQAQSRLSGTNLIVHIVLFFPAQCDTQNNYFGQWSQTNYHELKSTHRDFCSHKLQVWPTMKSKAASCTCHM